MLFILLPYESCFLLFPHSTDPLTFIIVFEPKPLWDILLGKNNGKEFVFFSSNLEILIFFFSKVCNLHNLNVNRQDFVGLKTRSHSAVNVFAFFASWMVYFKREALARFIVEASKAACVRRCTPKPSVC